jgi:hypothetical protein
VSSYATMNIPAHRCQIPGRNAWGNLIRRRRPQASLETPELTHRMHQLHLGTLGTQVLQGVSVIGAVITTAVKKYRAGCWLSMWQSWSTQEDTNRNTPGECMKIMNQNSQGVLKSDVIATAISKIVGSCSKSATTRRSWNTAWTHIMPQMEFILKY